MIYKQNELFTILSKPYNPETGVVVDKTSKLDSVIYPILCNIFNRRSIRGETIESYNAMGKTSGAKFFFFSQEMLDTIFIAIHIEYDVDDRRYNSIDEVKTAFSSLSHDDRYLNLRKNLLSLENEFTLSHLYLYEYISSQLDLTEVPAGKLLKFNEDEGSQWQLWEEDNPYEWFLQSKPINEKKYKTPIYENFMDKILANWLVCEAKMQSSDELSIQKEESFEKKYTSLKANIKSQKKDIKENPSIDIIGTYNDLWGKTTEIMGDFSVLSINLFTFNISLNNLKSLPERSELYSISSATSHPNLFKTTRKKYEAMGLEMENRCHFREHQFKEALEEHKLLGMLALSSHHTGSYIIRKKSIQTGETENVEIWEFTFKKQCAKSVSNNFEYVIGKIPDESDLRQAILNSLSMYKGLESIGGEEGLIDFFNDIIDPQCTLTIKLRINNSTQQDSKASDLNKQVSKKDKIIYDLKLFDSNYNIDDGLTQFESHKERVKDRINTLLTSFLFIIENNSTLNDIFKKKRAKLLEAIGDIRSLGFEYTYFEAIEAYKIAGDSDDLIRILDNYQDSLTLNKKRQSGVFDEQFKSITYNLYDYFLSIYEPVKAWKIRQKYSKYLKATSKENNGKERDLSSNKNMPFLSLFYPRFIYALLITQIALIMSEEYWKISFKIESSWCYLISITAGLAGWIFLLIEINKKADSIKDTLTRGLGLCMIGSIFSLIISTLTSLIMARPMIDIFFKNDSFDLKKFSLGSFEFVFSLNGILLWSGLSLFFAIFIHIIWGRDKISSSS